MGEFDYIAWIRQRTLPAANVLVGPGDDAAVIKTVSNRPWLVTTDMMLEGIHFPPLTPPFQGGGKGGINPRRVGRKAIAVNLSDIAAMGGRPIAAFVSVGLPRGNAESLGEELYLGMREMADRFETAIAGGDTNTWTNGLVVSVTLMGEPGPQGPIQRFGAKPGDWLFVTGPLGGSILGKHLDFVPRVEEGLRLQEHAAIHAMIDISDGLSADVFHICEESRCGAVLFSDKIPIAEAAFMFADGKTPLEHALSDGEDFELAFAVDSADGERLLRTQPIPGTTLSHLGVCVAEKELYLEENATRRRIEPRGYAHPFR